MFFYRKTFYCSLIITILTAIALPYSYNMGHKYEFGYPFAFLTIYDNAPPISEVKILLMRISIDLLMFVINVMLIYVVLYSISLLYMKIWNKKNAN